MSVGTDAQLQSAIANLQNGDTVQLETGVYTLTSSLFVRQSGVTIRGRTDACDDVVLVGKGMNNASFGNVPYGIWSDALDLTIANLTIRDTYSHPIIFNPGAENPRVYNVRLVDAGEQFIKANPSTNGGVDNGLIEYVVMEYTAGPPMVDHGGGTGYTNGISAHRVKNWTVRRSLFKDFHAPDHAQNLWSPALLFWNNSEGTLVDGNTFINVDRAVAFGLFDNQGSDHSGGIVRNNFVYQEPGLYSAARKAGSDGQIIVWDSPATKVLHNTILTSGNSNCSIEFRFNTAAGEARNNLSDTGLCQRDGASFSISGNHLTATTALFVAASDADLHLEPTAGAAIDRVAVLADSAEDIDGDVRPHGIAADIGADELRQASQPFTATTTPTATRTATSTQTATRTPTHTRTRTPTHTRTATWTSTRTHSPTHSPTATRSASRTPTNTATHTATSTPTRTATPTQSPTQTPTTVPPSATPITPPTPTATVTPTPSPSPTPSPETMEVNGLVTYHASSDPVSGVEVRTTGANGAMAVTNVRGEFGFSGLAGGDFQIEPRKIGGDNGAISSLDAAWALQASVGMRDLTPEQLVACDVTGNGSVSALDAARILQRVVGRIPTLPVADSCGSDWAFLPDADVVPHQGVFDPIFAGGDCQAGAISFTPLDGDAQHQDFRAVLFGDCTGNWHPETAPAFVRRSGQPLARLGRPRRNATRSEIVVPLHVDGGDPFHAFEASLTFDPARVRSARARIANAAGGAVLEVNSRRDGRFTVALASVEPVDPAKGAILEVVYELKGRDHRVGRVRIVDVSLEE